MARKDILNIMIFLLSVMLMLFTFAHKKLVDRDQAIKPLSLLPRHVIVNQLMVNEQDFSQTPWRDRLTTNWQKPRSIRWQPCPSTFKIQGYISFYSQANKAYDYTYYVESNELIINEQKSSKCVSIDGSLKEALLPTLP